jgi:tetratricopeptide (TPR) repeat protein
MLSRGKPAEGEPPTETFVERPAGQAEEPVESWGRFENLERLGEGGFGSVYKAFDPSLRREVALKLLHGGADAAGQQALLEEARTLARMRHPNIVPVYGVEAHAGRVGFWSELIRGRTLASIVRAEGPMGAREVALAGLDLCAAAGAVHGQKLLHRDIKAENVMREEGGRLLLVDFGLSHDAGREGGLGGTPLYMAPELFRGERPSVASDIYALGVTLYFLASGRFPYEARTGRELAQAIGRGERTALADVRPDFPAELTRVIERAAHPEAAKRFATAGRLQVALSEFLALASRGRSRRWMAVAAAGLAAAGAGLYLKHVYERGTASPAAHESYLAGQKLMARDDQPGHLDKALAEFEKAVATDPKFALGHAAVAQARWTRFVATRDKTELDGALASANRAMELNSGISGIYVVQGEIHNWTGKRDLALEELQRAVKLDGRNAAAHRALGSLYLKLGRMEEAEESYRRAMNLDPENWEHYFAAGNFELRRSNLDRAAGWLEDALDRSPNNPLVLTNLGSVYLRQEELGKARTMFERVVKVEPRYRALANLGNILMLEGRYREARRAFEEALRRNDADFGLWGTLAMAHRHGGDGDGKAGELFRKAAEMGERAREADPKNSRLLASLGGYYAVLGEKEKSLPILRQAVALGPDDSDTNFHAGEGFELLGLREEALRAVNHAMERGYPALYVERSPDLASLRGDPRYRKRPRE